MENEVTIPSGYNYVWSEEFNSDSVRFSDWNIEARPSGVINNEFQEYVQSEENIFVRDNMLHIRPVQKFDDEGRAFYTSGLLTTQGKHEYTYGRFEVRAKIPYGHGLIPFIKLCSDAKKYGAWPMGGQIDIMQIPCDRPEKQFATVHYGAKATNQQGAYLFPVGTDAACDFHKYSVDWVPGHIKFAVDDIDFFEVNIDSPFDHAFYFSIGLAIGGNLAGNPNECTRFEEDNSFIIDYIRVFQKEEYSKNAVSKQRKVITVCGGWEDAENFNTFLNKLNNPLIRKDYVVAAFSFGAPDDVDNPNSYDEMKFADFISKQEMEAIVVFAEMIRSKAVVDRIVSDANLKNIPVFILEHSHENAININIDFEAGFEKVCRHMIEHHNLKNVDMFAGTRGNVFSDKRIEVFKKVLGENGIAFDERMIHYGNFEEKTAYAVLCEMLDAGYELPEAIICANDSMAVGVEQALLKRGYKIPDDIKISGLDGIRASQNSYPAITSASPDYSVIISRMLEIIENWDNEEVRTKAVSEPIEIGYDLLVNNSCGCMEYDVRDWSSIMNQAANDSTDCFRHLLEMGKFVSNNIKSDNMIDAMASLESYVRLWKNQFYFIGLQGGDMKLRALFIGRNNEYKHDQRYMHLDTWLPDMESHLDENSGENILLFKLVRLQSNDFAFVCCGYDSISFRDQQRFEEFSLFVSAVFNSVYNNQKYIRANKEIERISEMDYLTGLYNRRGFFRELDNRIVNRRGTGSKLGIALFSVDMDGLKTINDDNGHMEGDAALTVFANILLRFTGGNGICARYGGDEFAFAFFVDDLETIDIDFVRSSIDALIASDYTAQRKPYKIGASIGFAEAMIDSSFNMEDLIKEADSSMYIEKQRRKAARS